MYNIHSFHRITIITIYYYYAAFNVPCVSHKDDKSQARSELNTYINAVRAKSWAIKSLKSVPDVKKGVLTPSTSTKFLTPGFTIGFFDAEPSQPQ